MSSAVTSRRESVASRPAKRASGSRPRSSTISRSPSRLSSDRTRPARSGERPRRRDSSSSLCCYMLTSIVPPRASVLEHIERSALADHGRGEGRFLDLHGELLHEEHRRRDFLESVAKESARDMLLV